MIHLLQIDILKEAILKRQKKNNLAGSEGYHSNGSRNVNAEQ